MGTIKVMVVVVFAAGIAMVLGGCKASYQARSMDVKGGLLVNPDILQKGSGDQALYRYENPKVAIRKYTKVMIDPVLISKAAQLDATAMENYQKLANNAYLYMKQELQKDYQIVQTPEAGTLRIQMAIIDADKSKPVRNVLSSVMPIGIGVSVAKYSATGKQSGVGEITAEFKITDATTGELLGAAVDRRVGGKAAAGMWDTWYNADEALKYWAKRARYVLCERRVGTGCEKP
jgi:hypothetical protein